MASPRAMLRVAIFMMGLVPPSGFDISLGLSLEPEMPCFLIMRDAMKYSKFMNLRKTIWCISYKPGTACSGIPVENLPAVGQMQLPVKVGECTNYRFNGIWAFPSNLLFSLFVFLAFLMYGFFFGTSGFSQELTKEIKPGAERISEYLPLIKDKRIALVANQTSVVGEKHLVDTLLSLGINVKKVFAPEHGFRGLADAGEHVKNSKDKKTGLPVISLYGKHKKPSAKDLSDVDVVIFDIQDVGVRYYTYISTMQYVMEACAENEKKILVFDRPNPNGFYVDGPLLQEECKSFVGLFPIPLVHGLTVGELARMITGEKWFHNSGSCDLEIITCENYSHRDFYRLPVKPSPNLPNMLSVYLYPSLGFFEGTIVSVGRGTPDPFQVFGHPEMKNTSFNFIPAGMEGAKNPPYEGLECFGFNLKVIGENDIRNYKKMYLQWLLVAYHNSPDKSGFFLKNNFFNLLAGNKQLMEQVKEGMNEREIRKSWEHGLEKYRTLRKKYLLYEDFE